MVLFSVEAEIFEEIRYYILELTQDSTIYNNFQHEKFRLK